MSIESPVSGSAPSGTRRHHRRVPGVGYGAVAGAVAGALGVGFGLLTSRILVLVTGRGASGVADGTPTWLWWLSNEILNTGNPLWLVLITSATLVAAGAVAGVLSRQRDSPGLVIFALLGVVGLWEVWSTNSGRLDLAVPVVATVAAMAGLRWLMRVGRSAAAAPAPTGGVRVGGPSPAGEGRSDDPRRLRPRRAVLGGILLAAGAGAAGLIGTGAPVTPRPTPPIGPRPAGGAPLLRGSVVDLRTLGAVGDGLADDTAAVRRGLDAVRATGGTLYFPAGTYRYASPLPIDPGPGVTMAGDPGRTVIDFAPSDSGGFRLGCSVEADDVTIDGLTLRRDGDYDAVLLSTGAFRRFTLSRTALVGNMDLHPDTYCHGIKLSDSAVSQGMHMVDSTITTTQYGLFQSNMSTADTTDVLVERCSFSRNLNTDLEFNSPGGQIRQVTVRSCSFTDNDSPGFGVGLANVQGAVIRDNSFERYAMEAVHVEDYSTDIVVQANDFTACGLRLHSFVQIISGANDVRVLDNSFDASMNTNEVYVVTSQPAGVGVTGSGRPIVPPYGVVLGNNRMECSPAVTPAYLQGNRGSSIVGNQITGEALTEAADAFQLIDSADTVVSDNTVNGRAV